LNTAIDDLNAESIAPDFFNPANMDADKMPDIIKQLDDKIVLFKQYDETSERYNDWQNKLYVPTTNF